MTIHKRIKILEPKKILPDMSDEEFEQALAEMLRIEADEEQK